MPKGLSTRRVEAYDRDGFIAPVPILAADEVAHYRRCVEHVEASMGGVFRGLERTKFYLLYPWAY